MKQIIKGLGSVTDGHESQETTKIRSDQHIVKFKPIQKIKG